MEMTKFLDEGQWLLERLAGSGGRSGRGRSLDGQVESGGRDLGWRVAVSDRRNGARRRNIYVAFF